MNRIVRFFIICLIALVWGTSPSLAQKRVALVVGNSSYTKIQSLPNPANDSQLMAKTLRQLNFEVVTATDVDFLGMRRAVKEFGRKLRASGKDATGLFYYAGHGVQAQGSNFLIPLGAEVADEADLEIEAISASDVLAQMEAAGNKLNLVILDACRNNPYKSKLRSNSRGLARLNAASGSLVAFSAAPGQVAADGSGDNSPYTSALVKAMQVPGLSVEQMFKRVRISVESQTNNQQTPWEESSLRGEFYFNSQKAEPQPVSGPKVNPATPFNQAAQEWATIQNSRSTAVLNAFINRYPQSIYADYARLTLEEKKASAKRLAKIQMEEAKKSILKETKKRQITSLPKPSIDNYLGAQTMSSYELTILLQAELTRVGCNPGAIDGQWGANGRRALALFKLYANVTLPYKDISPQVVEAVKQRRSRVCPLTVPENSLEVKTAVNKSAFKINSKECKDFYKEYKQKPKTKVFALSSDGNWCGAGWGFSTKSEAKERAMFHCNDTGASGCRIIDSKP